MKIGVSNTIPNIVTLPGQGGGGGLDPAAFVTEWTIAAGGDAAARTITLYGHGGITLNNYDVDWGDGTAIETGITTAQK